MHENLLFHEFTARTRTRELEAGIQRAQQLAEIGRDAPPISARGRIAAALVRLAMFVDANAGRRAAAVTQ